MVQAIIALIFACLVASAKPIKPHIYGPGESFHIYDHDDDPPPMYGWEDPTLCGGRLCQPW